MTRSSRSRRRGAVDAQIHGTRVLVEGQVKGGITATERIELGSKSRGRRQPERRSRGDVGGRPLRRRHRHAPADDCGEDGAVPQRRGGAGRPMTGGAGTPAPCVTRSPPASGGLRRRHSQGHQHPDRPLAQLRQQRRRADHHFKPNDTIYVAVLTDGSGSATIGAKFSHLGRVVAEPEKKVSYRGAAATEFHLDYAGGVPPASTTSRCSSTASRPACAKSASSPDASRDGRSCDRHLQPARSEPRHRPGAGAAPAHRSTGHRHAVA